MHDVSKSVDPPLNVPNLQLKVLEFFLDLGVFLRHLLVLFLPLVSCGFESLDFAFVVACFDIGLAEPVSHNTVSFIVSQY